MIAVWWYYLVAAVMLGMIIALLIRNGALTDRVSDLETEVEVAEDNYAIALTLATEHRQAYADLVSIVTPLLEKTDWCSGRYARSIEVLQAREATRNREVDKVRSAIMTSRAVDEVPMEDRLKQLTAEHRGKAGWLA